MMKKQATRPQARPAVAAAGRKVTPLLAQVLQADLLTALSTVRITRAALISPTTPERSAHP